MKIVIWTGGALETWGPHSIVEGGIGGSETAAIRMAEKLADLGHHVEIWGKVTPATIMPAGGGRVLYVEHDGTGVESQRLKIECDVFISSRELAALSEIKPKCGLSVLWMHDAHAGEDWQDLMSGYDVVFCLSRWARGFLMGYYSRVVEDKFVVTRNGIEPSLFLRDDEASDRIFPVMKNGQKFIYSSSPDRGLRRLLHMWPEIKSKIVEAELHVYYGFDNLRAWYRLHGSPGSIEKLAQVDYLEHLLDELRSSGVYHHGRVGQADLARAFMESCLWLYPTSFCETSCITAMEAQAAGSGLITSRIGALPETVFGGTLVDDPQEPAYDRIFVRKVVDFVDDVGGCRTATSADRWENRRRVLSECSWRGVAAEWERLFEARLNPSG